jgi:hypothetical protein
VGIPEYYLGGDFKLYRRTNEIDTVTVCAKTYIINVCKRIKETLGITLKSYETPMATNDHPEIDDSGFLNHDGHSKYRMLIGCGQWSIILGRIDVMHAIQTMARYAASPKEGHMQRMIRIFGYLKHYYRYGIIFDDLPHHLPELQDVEVNWEEQYPGAMEELPPDMPQPKGKEVHFTMYVDADHASDQETRRSVTGFILFINNTPVKWYSKRQNTIETSTYGAELVALRIAVEAIIDF